MSDKKLCRKFLGILYSDSESYNCELVIDSIRGYFDKYAYILHNRDCCDDGTLKKSHVHWVGSLKYGVDISTISNKLGVPVNMIEYCNDWKKANRYLIHDGWENKTQYDAQEVFSNYNFVNYLSPKERSEQVFMIISTMEQSDMSLRQLVRWCCDNGCWSEFYRAYPIFKDIRFEIMKERGI